MVSTLIKRASLDDAFDLAVSANTTLRVQLRASVTSARASISTGQLVSSVSRTNGAGGSSVSFSQPDTSILGSLTPEGLLEMWQYLVDLYDAVVLQQGLTDSTTDRLAIYTEMKGLLAPCKVLERSSFVGLHCE